jgi:hypothetical protein
MYVDDVVIHLIFLSLLSREIFFLIGVKAFCSSSISFSSSELP